MPAADSVSHLGRSSHNTAPLPAQLQNLIERARFYVEAASSANTQTANAFDRKHFSARCRRQNLSPSLRTRKSSGSTSRLRLRHG